MREIKYKAYWHDSKLMTLVDTIEFLKGGTRVSDGCMHTGWVGKGCELVEYTGLKDKNGVEIYEGDIVETVYNGEVFAGVVVYDLSEVDFKVTDGKEKYGRNFQYLAGNDENEVIGNIYENPELLESKKD